MVTFPLHTSGPTALRTECQCVWHGLARLAGEVQAPRAPTSYGSVMPPMPRLQPQDGCLEPPDAHGEQAGQIRGSPNLNPCEITYKAPTPVLGLDDKL